MTWRDRARKDQAGRDCALLAWKDDAGVLKIAHRGTVTLYLVRRQGAILAPGHYSLRPLCSPEEYHVLLGGYADSQCECRGYLASGYCRHLIALFELRRRGEWPDGGSNDLTPEEP